MIVAHLDKNFLFMEEKVSFRVHERLLVPTLSQIKPENSLQTYFLTMNFNVILPLKPRFSDRHIPFMP
jgi:hypothetical protein